jgi:hypothetical protein
MSKRVRVEEEGEDNNVDDDGDRAWTLYQVPPIRSIVDSSLGGIRNLLRFLSASRVGEETVEATLRDAIRRDIVGRLDWSRRFEAKTTGRAPSPECLFMEGDLFGDFAQRAGAFYPPNFMHLWDFDGDPSKEHFSLKTRLRQFDKLKLVALYRHVFDGLVVLACIAFRSFARVLSYAVGRQPAQIVIRDTDGGNRLLTLSFRGAMIKADVAVDDTPFAVALGQFLDLVKNRPDDSDEDDSVVWHRAFARLLFDLYYNVSPRCAITFDAASAQAPGDDWVEDDDLPPPFPGGTLSLATNGQLARPGANGDIVYSNVY